MSVNLVFLSHKKVLLVESSGSVWRSQRPHQLRICITVTHSYILLPSQLLLGSEIGQFECRIARWQRYNLLYAYSTGGLPILGHLVLLL